MVSVVSGDFGVKPFGCTALNRHGVLAVLGL